MARPLDFNKGDLEKRRLQKKKEKEQKKEERKANSKKTSFEDMIAYMDENGNITSTPPDPTRKKEVKTEDIVIGSRNVQSGNADDPIKKGRVTFFNTSKGFGFIRDSQTGEDLFVHVNSLLSPIQENDIVTFESERGPKGLNAVRVKKA